MREGRRALASIQAAVLAALALPACTRNAAVSQPAAAAAATDSGALAVGTVASQLYWSDGDSGRINGLPFRLADIDAPETGGVGARGGAKCEGERVLGFAAKAWVVEMTRTGRAGNAAVFVTDLANVDRYGRQVLNLSVDGRPLNRLGTEAGHYGAWPHRKGRALSPKPNWCGNER